MIFWVFECPVARYQIPVGLSEAFSPSQLFQNLAAYYFMGSFYFTGGLMGVFLPSATVSLQCSGVFPQIGCILSAWTLQRQFRPFLLSILRMYSLYLCGFSLQFFVFSHHFSKCRSLALHILISDEIVVMDNNISCLAWQCNILLLSVVHPAAILRHLI